MHLHTLFHRSTHFFHWNFDFQQHETPPKFKLEEMMLSMKQKGGGYRNTFCFKLCPTLAMTCLHVWVQQPHLSIQTTPLYSDHTFLLISIHWLCYSKCHLYFSQFPFWSHLWSPGPMFSVATTTEAIASAWIKAYGPCVYYLFASQTASASLIWSTFATVGKYVQDHF